MAALLCVGALAMECCRASARVRRIQRCAPMSFEGCPSLPRVDADKSQDGWLGMRDEASVDGGATRLEASMSMS